MKYSEEEYRELELTLFDVRYQLREHGVEDLQEFFQETGERDVYTGADVLNFLGY